MPNPVPPTPAVAPDLCAGGRHRLRRGSDRQDGSRRRAVCRGCGCAIVRVEATRRWIRSGLLG